MPPSELIAENLARVRQRMICAAERAGRKPEELTLVAISKTFPAEFIRRAFAAGIRHFGENRVQEWQAKHAQLADLDAVWHLVGHLQSNKAVRAVQLFSRIDSVDSLELAKKIDSAAAPLQKLIPILVEVRLDLAAAKSGVLPSDLPAFLTQILPLTRLRVCGLMTLPPYLEDVQKARPYFRRLRELRDAMRATLGGPAASLSELSMGMSHDFEVAIEEGATQVRIGTAIFGPRPAP